MEHKTKYDFYCEEALSGKTKVDIVYESQAVLAFHHTKPSYPVHIVIVPKKHIPSLVEVHNSEEQIIVEVMRVAQQLAKTLNLNEGVRLTTNMGKFQDTPHLHFHLTQGIKKENV